MLVSSYKVELQSPAPVMALVTIAQVAVALLALVTAAVTAVAVASAKQSSHPPLRLRSRQRRTLF